MDRRVNIPVKILQPTDPRRLTPRPPRPVVAPVEPVEAGFWTGPEAWREGTSHLQAPAEALESEVARLQAALKEQRQQTEGAQSEAEEWRELALRSQADMDNYRKRQRRLAQDEIAVERQRLLSNFLRIVDDLERALAAPAGDADGLRQGVELTHRAALKMLHKEGVESIPAENQPFDPNWHQAVSTAASNDSDLAPNTVAHVLEPGYRLGETLLRPAKVVVAV